jgi:uncharacterized cupredoxin-like copper-binding protein
MYNINLKKVIGEHKLLGVLVISGVLVLSQAACTGVSAPIAQAASASTAVVATAPAPASTEVVTVSMTDFAFKFTPSTIKAGVVKFIVKNDASEQMHEMFLVKTDLAVDKLPLEPDGSSINEDSNQFTKLGSVEDVDAGKSGEMTVKLEPGRYVYFCNKPGHYKMGMAGEITVVP